jgi:hypothetical protein
MNFADLHRAVVELGCVILLVITLCKMIKNELQ